MIMQEIEVFVHPNSKKREIRFDGEKIKIYVKSPPEKGKANAEVLKVIEEIFGCKAEILKGLRSKRKIILLKNINRETTNKILNELRSK